MKAFLKSILEQAHAHLKLHKWLRAISEGAARAIQPEPRIIVFGAANGKFYGDNSRHLFEWVVNNRPDIKPVWLTRKTMIVRQLRARGYRCYWLYGPQGIFMIFKARIAVFTNSLGDFALSPYIIPNRLRLIALRHGRSVKKIRFARETHPISTSEMRERQRESELIAFAISTSDFISQIQEDCLRIGIEKHKVTGYPRNDFLIDSKLWNQSKLPGCGQIEPKHVVLYGPSWRHGREPTRFFPFDDFDPQALAEVLESRKILLLLRPHLRDLEKYPSLGRFLGEISARSSFIRVASHKDFPDVNLLLPKVDCLISDYSALYHDFLLLDRPMGFIPYDFEQFQNCNGFNYDYFDNLPGPALASQADFINFLEDFSTGADPCADRRHKLAQKIHHYKDAGSCRRVMELIDTFLARKHT